MVNNVTAATDEVIAIGKGCAIESLKAIEGANDTTPDHEVIETIGKLCVFSLSLIARIEALKAENEELREFVEDAVWQFASHGVKNGKPNINTMGLSTLERGFEILGYDDPHEIDAQKGETNE